MVQLSWTELRHGLKPDFEVIGGKVSERGMPSFGSVVGNVVTAFKCGFCAAGEVATVKQLGFEAAPKGFGVGRTW